MRVARIEVKLDHLAKLFSDKANSTPKGRR
jgi:hypothetical protein